MKNRIHGIFSLVLCAVLVLALAACGTPGAPASADEPPSLIQPIGEDTVSAGDGQPAARGGLRLLGDAAQLPNATMGAACTRGFYELVNPVPLHESRNPYTNIWYTDYATRQQAVLCGQPGCAHTDTTCAAFLPHDPYMYILGEAGGGLVLVYTGDTVTEYNQKTGEVVSTAVIPGSVVMMDHSGENRREIYAIPEGQRAQRFMATDDEYLYLTLQWAGDGSSESGRDTITAQLTRIDLDTGAAAPVYTFGEVFDHVFGVLDGKLLLTAYEPPEQPPAGNAPLEDGYGARVFFTLDLATGKKTELPVDFSFLHQDYMVQVSDGPLIWTTRMDDPDIYQANLETGEHSTLLRVGQNRRVQLLGCLDGRLFCELFTTDEEGEPGPAEYRWVDVATGEDHPFPLHMAFSYMDNGEERRHEGPVMPVAAANGMYLVNQSFDTSGGIFAWQPLRALISAEDFWAGRPAFQPVTIVE